MYTTERRTNELQPTGGVHLIPSIYRFYAYVSSLFCPFAWLNKLIDYLSYLSIESHLPGYQYYGQGTTLNVLNGTTESIFVKKLQTTRHSLFEIQRHRIKKASRQRVIESRYLKRWNFGGKMLDRCGWFLE